MSVEHTLVLTGPDNYYIKLLGFVAGIIILSIFCFIDDLKGIPPYVKLIGQILAAVVVTYSGVKIDKVLASSIGGVITNNTLSFFITVIWIVGITNAINLIDGLDGLSSGVSLISCVSLLIIFSLNSSPLISIILITALAGSLLGFIPFNFHPAKTFIGDTGANFLGYSLSIISILGVAKTYTAIVLIAPLIIFALPLLDTAFAIIRRIFKTKSFSGVFKADKEHFHHKIIRHGYSQKQAVFILYGISASFGMFAIILLESGIYKAISFALMIFAIATIGYKDIVTLGKELKNKDEIK